MMENDPGELLDEVGKKLYGNKLFQPRKAYSLVKNMRKFEDIKLRNIDFNERHISQASIDFRKNRTKMSPFFFFPFYFNLLIFFKTGKKFGGENQKNFSKRSII